MINRNMNSFVLFITIMLFNTLYSIKATPIPGILGQPSDTTFSKKTCLAQILYQLDEHFMWSYKIRENISRKGITNFALSSRYKMNS